MKETCVVLGGGGFIGHHLINYLHSKGHMVFGADIQRPKYPINHNGFAKLDLTNIDNCLQVTKVDWVFQLAAENGSIELTTTDRANLVHNNSLINLNIAEACKRNNVKRVFFSSSACVYPIELQNTDKIHALTESDAYPANPDSEYGWEKLFSERIYQDYNKDFGLDVRIARFINIYGPECLIDTLRSKAPLALTRKVIESRDHEGAVEIWGDGNQKRTFCYIDDLLDGIYKFMSSNIMTSPTNLGSDYLVSINELVDLIAEIEGVEISKVHQLDKVQGVRTRQANIRKAKEELGWQPTTSLVDGLKEVNKFVHKELER
jgi:GDP-D-mannose 3',5'-epimerase